MNNIKILFKSNTIFRHYFQFYIFLHPYGDIAQLARVRDWQSRGQGFDSPYLHVNSKTINLRQEVFCFLYGSNGACSSENCMKNKKLSRSK